MLVTPLARPDLEDYIAQEVYTNPNEEIDGDRLQQVLLYMAASFLNLLTDGGTVGGGPAPTDLSELYRLLGQKASKQELTVGLAQKQPKFTPLTAEQLTTLTAGYASLGLDALLLKLVRAQGTATGTLSAIALPGSANTAQLQVSGPSPLTTGQLRYEFLPITSTPTVTLAAPTNLTQTASTTSSITVSFTPNPNGTGTRLRLNGSTLYMAGTASSYTLTGLAVGSTVSIDAQSLGGNGYNSFPYSAAISASTQSASGPANSTDADGNPPQNDTSTYQSTYTETY